MGGTYNAKTGLAYFGTGNLAPRNSHLRKGDNLFSCSTVAIDVKTGQIVWHYQNTPNDGWDFDGVNEFVTYDDGGQILGGKADATASSTSSTTPRPASSSTPSRSSRRSPGPPAST